MDVPPATAASSTIPDAGRGALRVGVIGLGVGEQHVAGYREHPGCSVTALCDASATRREEIAARHPDVALVAEADAVLRDPDIDVVSIATYDDDHAPQVLTALAHGKHVFVEKPLCLTTDEAHRIRSALDARPDLRLSSNLILRRSPRLRRLRAMIGDGTLGAIFHVEGAYDYGRLHKLTEGWRGRIPGYSVVLGGAVHLVDALRWLTGDEVAEVTACGNGIASRGSSFKGDDMVAALLRFERGTTGTVTANFGCVRPHGHGLTVCGTRATFVNGAPHGMLYTSRDPEVAPQAITDPHPGAAKGDLIAAFIDDILGRGASEVTAEEVFRTLAVCLAIDRARHEGRPVSVEKL